MSINFRLKQNLENVNKTKKYIFKNLHLEILEENYKIVNNAKKYIVKNY
ncbi:hypothetical protein QIA20_07415 (plasmid) [Borreliella japonica]